MPHYELPKLIFQYQCYYFAGNWMWLSASAFFTAYFRVYSPIKFGQKYDPQGEFIKRFLPVLKVCAECCDGRLPLSSTAHATLPPRADVSYYARLLAELPCQVHL